MPEADFLILNIATKLATCQRLIEMALMDHDMAKEARAIFRTVRGDLETCRESADELHRLMTKEKPDACAAGCPA
jgi:hypothetical protein